MSATADSIRDLLERERFKPFRLVMSSGKTYDATTPNSAMLLKSAVLVVFPDGEHWADVPCLHISSIETFGNGAESAGGPRSNR